jgi:uncharacterized protein YjiK
MNARALLSGWSIGFPVALAVTLGRSAALGEDPWLPRYDLREGAARVHRLERRLGEISGLAFDERGRLFGHADERAEIHELDPATGRTLRTITIGDARMRGDFEGLAIAGRRFFIMTSGGTLLDFAEPAEGSAAPFRRVDTGLAERCELEGLAYDRATDALLVPCKNTRGRALDDQLAIFAIPLATLRPDPRPRVAVPYARLEAAGIERGFHPSSVEVHPRSGSLFLLSAQEEAVVEIGRDGGVLASRDLSRRRHPQPEGLSFGPDLALWIADEGGSGRGTLTRYPPPAGGPR